MAAWQRVMVPCVSNGGGGLTFTLQTTPAGVAVVAEAGIARADATPAAVANIGRILGHQRCGHEQRDQQEPPPSTLLHVAGGDGASFTRVAPSWPRVGITDGCSDSAAVCHLQNGGGARHHAEAALDRSLSAGRGWSRSRYVRSLLVVLPRPCFTPVPVSVRRPFYGIFLDRSTGTKRELGR